MALLLTALAAGCGGGGGGRDAILGVTPTVGIAPTVTAVAPVRNATGVPINTKIITAAFSKAMDPATLTNAFTLACPAATPVTGGAVTYLAAGNVATLTLPAANLPVSTICTATITTAAKDTTGIALAANYTWNFTTGATADTAKPRVTLTVPVNLAPAAPANTAITATFNEAMAPATITATSFTLTGPGGVAVTGAAIPVTYSVVSKTATFTPAAALAVGATYTATIKGTGAGAATDLAGNILAGGVSTTVAADYVWTFTTAAPDVTPPTVTLVNPADLGTLVCLNKTINATFSEAMNSGSISNLTFTLAPTATPGTPVAGVVAYDPLTDIASFNPDANLTASTNYTATIKGGASGVKDVAGNAMTVDKVWTFDTGTTLCLVPVNMGTAATFGISATAGMATAISSSTVNADVLLLPPTNVCNATTVPNDGTIGTCAAIGFPPTVNGTVISSAYDPAGTINTVRDDVFATFLSLCAPGVPAANCTMGAPGNIPTDLPAGTTLGAPSGSALVQGDNYFTPGLYQSLTSILITGDLTLDAQGDANAVFIFQASGPSPTIGTADAAGAVPAGRTRILLVNGAKASNVWWSAASSATIGTYSEFQGNILAAVSITLNNGATSCGRMMAGAWVGGGGAITLGGGNVVSVPGQPFVPPVSVPIYSATCQ